MDKILSSKLVGGCKLLMCFIKKLSIQKRIFIIDLQLGIPALVPTQMRQEDLPMSFRYYDPILRYIKS
jgi:hypothetical protein